MPRRSAMIATAGAIIAAIAVSGCTPAPAVIENSTPLPTTAADKASPTPSPISSTIPDLRVNYAKGEACAGLRSISNTGPADGIERILGTGLPADGAAYSGGYALPELRDTGPIDYAAGESVINSDGTPTSYVVAEGDTLYAISERFCVQFTPYLEWINSVRRNGAWAWSSDDDGTFAIYPGDTLNLDPHTITTVGDEQGVVYDHEPDFYIPPQR